MKYFISLLFITSVVGIAVFGSTLFNMGPNYSGNCIAFAIDGKTCSTNITDIATHHISAIQTLITTLPSNSGWFLLLAFLLLVLGSIFLFYKNFLYPKIKFLLSRLRDFTLHYFYSQQKIISWLSLFELSPALSISAH